MDSHSGQYEFTSGQNETLKRAATWTRLFAWIMMTSGGLMALGGVLSAEASSIGALISAAIYFIIGLNFRGAASSMQSVVETSGNDISHLMTSLDKLASAFKVMGILFLVGVVMVVVAIVTIGAWMGSLPT